MEARGRFRAEDFGIPGSRRTLGGGRGSRPQPNMGMLHNESSVPGRSFSEPAARRAAAATSCSFVANSALSSLVVTRLPQNNFASALQLAAHDL